MRPVTFFGYLIVFMGLLLTSLVWLVVGLPPAIAGGFPGLHASWHSWGETGGMFSEMALNAAQAAHNARPAWEVVLDYLFSVFNVLLALVIVKLRPFDRVARLLGLGLLGTSVAFNLQAHDALQVIPARWIGWVDLWHVGVHVVSGLAYVFAMVLFPDGKLPAANPYLRALSVPLLAFVAMIAFVLSMITTDDHTTGLVVLFGLFVPGAGLASQPLRMRKRVGEERQQSKVLIWALLLAIAAAVPLMILGSTSAGAPRETVRYEVPPLTPGTYFFRCDPHPEDMIGILTVGSVGKTQPIHLTALNSRFDQDRITLPAGRATTIRFTNRDTDLHNIAIYVDATATEPLFIGAEFSGSRVGVVAFRVFRVVLAAIPIALIVGLLRFRLWNVERVLSRTIAYGALAAMITAGYVAVVVGVGTAIGAGRRLNLVLSVFVTAVLAVAFQPLRERARRLADRMVYGKKATPYEVLSELSDRLAETYAIDEIAPRLAAAIGQGTGASKAEIWLRVDEELVRVGRWPDDGPTGAESIPVSGEAGIHLPHADRVVAVEYGGQILGGIAVTKPAGEELAPVEQRLLQNVASQAGLLLRNAQLNAQLEQRLDQLRESRQRIIAAQDTERRRLEQDIHDGAQQHLVAISAKLRLAQDLSMRDPRRAAELLDELQSDTSDTLAALRDLARGIYPPVLRDRGLVVALEAHARRCHVPVRVEGRGVGRHHPEVENAVYFCCLEAIQNAVKHADSPVEIKLMEDGKSLVFSVRDQGRGFQVPQVAGAPGTGLDNMSDRIAAVGGELKIHSTPGGTTIFGSIPTA